MTDTTTIQVRKDQAEDLKEMARENGNYKTVIDRLLEGYSPATNDGVDTEQLAEQLQEHIDYPEQQDTAEIVQRLEDLETRLPRKVAEELQHG